MADQEAEVSVTTTEDDNTRYDSTWSDDVRWVKDQRLHLLREGRIATDVDNFGSLISLTVWKTTRERTPGVRPHLSERRIHQVKASFANPLFSRDDGPGRRDMIRTSSNRAQHPLQRAPNIPFPHTYGYMSAWALSA
ncbi:hypothetical protein D9613_011563 [Agrocybe pediades]|uniref:Uncharacterized protein n=1 Tax=Agrocybe pediades TaxID=84607 RepID=A0A8H4QXW7_9AGAR|nr:hypothetical protein D9613_011563 [Agrocybe pediades]